MDKEEFKKEIIQQVMKEAAENGMVLTIREGAASIIHQPESVRITGAIDSPSRFIEKRNALYDKNKSHCLIDRDNKKIELVINEQKEDGFNYEITGQLVMSKEFVELGINSEKKYSPTQLANILKLKRSIFPKIAEHGIIVHTLRNIKATIQKKIEDLNDQRGNTTNVFVQTVESNMPSEFEIELPLIKGEGRFKFPLSVILEVENGDIVCKLESIEAQELIDQIVEKRIDEEIEKIKEFTTVIEK